jgi:hypothetical protein
MEAALSGISILMRYMDDRGEIVEDRFKKGKLFEIYELEAIRNFCQIKSRSRTTENSTNGMFTLT